MERKTEKRIGTDSKGNVWYASGIFDYPSDYDYPVLYCNKGTDKEIMLDKRSLMHIALDRYMARLMWADKENVYVKELCRMLNRAKELSDYDEFVETVDGITEQAESLRLAAWWLGGDNNCFDALWRALDECRNGFDFEDFIFEYLTEIGVPAAWYNEYLD